jgi:Heterokaryon incompatibility protein (HET)
MSGPSAKRQAQDLVVSHGKRPRVEFSHPSASDTEYTNHENSTNANNASQICHGCQKIDFETIFGENRQDSHLYKIWGNREFSLSHMNRQNNCALCQFFFSTREPLFNKTIVDPVCRLRVVPAKSELGAWKLPFDDSPVFIVLQEDWHTSNFRNAQGIIMELSESEKGFCGRQIQPRLNLSVVKEWLEFCHNNHKALCKEKSEPQIPQGFRVIDCLTRTIVCWEKISSPKDYIALSYVWGSKQESTIQDDAMSSVWPRTIEDTILLTANLGFRYLWVDRYCIPQENVADRQIQFQGMGEIYKHSVLTVIAAAGDDSHYGLPGIGAKLRECQPCVRVGNRTLVYTPYVKAEILNSKWNSRGWTYQEGLLSRKQLVFTPTQVYFQCNAMHCLESIQMPLKDLHIYNNIRMQDNVDISRVFPLRGLGKSQFDLNARLNEYLERSLTFEKDILDAFKGVLVAFERKFPLRVRTLCGIPILIPNISMSDLDGLVLGLSWRSLTFESGQHPKRRLEFPSWTWAGWKLSRIFLRGHLLGVRSNKAMVDVSVEYADQSVLPWIGNQKLILARDKLGVSPVIFRLCGHTLDLKIYVDGSISGYDECGIVLQIAKQLRNQSLPKHAVRQTIRSNLPSPYKCSSHIYVTLDPPCLREQNRKAWNNLYALTSNNDITPPVSLENYHKYLYDHSTYSRRLVE